MNEEKIIVLDFGGSIMVPDEIDASLIKKLRAFVEQKIRQGYFFVIIIGGGKTTRRYQQAGRALKFTDTLLDTIGIACTRVNATFLKNVCARLKPYPSVIENPLTLNQKIVKKYRLCFLGGWKPGASTDYVSFVAARTLGVEKIFMMSNIDFFNDMAHL
ncbi:MAG: hypothetical protein HYW78_00375 [Parcubacteria group bacterium]|nr:hypothetical protein [Parcubacteria group bacterium]